MVQVDSSPPPPFSFAHLSQLYVGGWAGCGTRVPECRCRFSYIPGTLSLAFLTWASSSALWKARSPRRFPGKVSIIIHILPQSFPIPSPSWPFPICGLRAALNLFGWPRRSSKTGHSSFGSGRMVLEPAEMGDGRRLQTFSALSALSASRFWPAPLHSS